MADNDTGWETIKEGDRVIRRRVYTIPAPDAGKDAGPPNKSTKKKKPISKHQRMLRQMRAQRDMEKEQEETLGAFADGALKDQILKYLKTMWILVTVGGLLLYFYAPDLVVKLLFGSKPRLVDRSLMTIYPSKLQVRKSLPLFFQAYSIARPGNRAAREAVKHVAELRQIGTYPGKYKQKIYLHAWEHADFGRQMRNHSMNELCGEGFKEQYRGSPGTSSKKKKDDLLLWCLLANGHHDGFIKFETSEITSQISQGRKGVAARYMDRNRIHSDSLLFLPLHDLADLKAKKKLKPSTMVPFAALEWVRTNAGLGDEAYVKLFEEFLYEWIEKEQDAWVLLNAACSKGERQSLKANQRMVATTCTKGLEEGGDEGEGESCCSFHDPNLKPIVRNEHDDEE